MIKLLKRLNVIKIGKVEIRIVPPSITVHKLLLIMLREQENIKKKMDLIVALELVGHVQHN